MGARAVCCTIPGGPWRRTLPSLPHLILTHYEVGGTIINPPPILHMRKLKLEELKNLPKFSSQSVVEPGFELRHQIQHPPGSQGINKVEVLFVNLLLVVVGDRMRASPAVAPVLSARSGTCLEGEEFLLPTSYLVQDAPGCACLRVYRQQEGI